MSTLVRKQYSPDDIQALMTSTNRRLAASAFATYYDAALAYQPPNESLKNSDVLGLLLVLLSERVTMILLRNNTLKTMEVAHAILYYHLHYNDSVDPMDLQLNLVVNIIGQSLRQQIPVKVSRFHAGEILVVECDFPDDFKLLVRREVFDKQLLDSPHLVIARWN